VGSVQEMHGTEDCVVSVDKGVRVNCRGDHVAGDRKCLMRERQVGVVRVVQKACMLRQ
jgi:hypothetical protein